VFFVSAAAAAAAARSVPPLVPFNLGSLGFLTPFDPASLEKVLHKTLRGEGIWQTHSAFVMFLFMLVAHD
jgi:NAD kinase